MFNQLNFINDFDLSRYTGIIFNLYIWREILIALAIFLIFVFIRKLFARYIFNFLLNMARKTGAEINISILNCFERPFRAFIVVLGFYLALTYLPLNEYQDVIVTKFFRASIIAFITWGFYNITGGGLFEEFREKVDIDLDEILIPFLSKVIRVIVVALGLSVIAQELGYDVSGFIAGLGLGGLAFALAAQDALSNIFGGIVIITDKPFSIGDWIYTPSVEGTVEDITFRSTRVRTFAKSLVTVPNSTLANEPITNWTKMGKRRITFPLGVTYTTSREKLQNCVDRIREMLETHPDVHKEVIFVRFDNFNDSSLDIFIYFFTITTNWGEFLAVKEDTNFKIMEILEDEGVSVAFPSRSLYFENPLVQNSSSEKNEHPGNLNDV